ncbi:hypothetical protein F4778DRAFT_101280 [Xylariomycetidae sp. FL2044]|nr:hypothetical protein F4778DRAFT_101280 [Xylariomycetidae sp. FL2044]
MMGLVKQFLSFVLTAASFQGLASAQLDFSQEDIVSGKALQSIGKTAYDNALARIGASAGTCTKDNVRVRKEWRNIPGEERTAFTNAVKCLMEDQPSVYTDLNSTGPRSMFDSFGVLHYLLTPYVHNSAYFLLFHRLYIWTYEEKLRTLCGYTGAFPYWEWGLDARSVEGSPLFDGSETSMGSNGAKVNSSSSPGGGGFGGFGGFGGGSGGGCVTEGPFVNYTVNFGPNTARDPLAYNPRCLKRNLNTAICASSASLQNTTGTILESPDIELFQGNVQGDFRYPESRKWGMAVHGGGHFAIGEFHPSSRRVVPIDVFMRRHYLPAVWCRVMSFRFRRRQRLSSFPTNYLRYVTMDE